MITIGDHPETKDPLIEEDTLMEVEDPLIEEDTLWRWKTPDRGGYPGGGPPDGDGGHPGGGYPGGGPPDGGEGPPGPPEDKDLLGP